MTDTNTVNAAKKQDRQEENGQHDGEDKREYSQHTSLTLCLTTRIKEGFEYSNITTAMRSYITMKNSL
jgi:hypothetical protein